MKNLHNGRFNIMKDIIVWGIVVLKDVEYFNEVSLVSF